MKETMIETAVTYTPEQGGAQYFTPEIHAA